jgi:type VI secretion system secreted protein Hcp
MGAVYAIFLHIDGLSGESTDEQHEDWIEVLSYSHSISQPAASSISSGSSRIAGRSEHQSFTVVKQLDKSSPKLALYCCSGTHIPEVILELCYVTGDRLRFMEYTLSDVMVSSVSPSGSVESGEARPIEEVSFSYGRIEWNYTEMDPDTGKAKGNVEAHWDLTTNTGG